MGYVTHDKYIWFVVSQIGIAPALGQITLTLNLKYPILLSTFPLRFSDFSL